MYPYQYSSPNMPTNGLERVKSAEDAKAYLLPLNSVSPPLFLESENAFFIKTTDSIGTGTVKKYTFSEVPMEDEAPAFVTRDYFDSQMKMIMEAINGKHPVPGQPGSEGQQ